MEYYFTGVQVDNLLSMTQSCFSVNDMTFVMNVLKVKFERHSQTMEDTFVFYRSMFEPNH